jgi:hypothetical protein
MCEFISWIEFNKEVFFLDDNKLNTKEGRELLKSEYKEDIQGHGAIRYYYPELKDRGQNRECINFNDPHNFPSKVVEAIKKGLFTNFGVCPKILTESALRKYSKEEQLAEKEYKKKAELNLKRYFIKIQQVGVKYRSITHPAWEEYEKKISLRSQEPYDEYMKKEQLALEEHWKEEQLARKIYYEAESLAWNEYFRTKLSIFWDFARKKENRIEIWK